MPCFINYRDLADAFSYCNINIHVSECSTLEKLSKLLYPDKGI